MTKFPLALLHTHSEHSYRDSIISVREMARAGSLYHAVALTDHGNVDGIVRFNKACREEGARPLFGCEVYALGTAGTKTPRGKFKPKLHHLTVLAKNWEGMKQVFRGLSTTNLETKTRNVDYWLENTPDCFILSGCASSPLWSELEPPDLKARWMEKFLARGRDGAAFEVQPLDDFDIQKTINCLAKEQANKTGFRIVGTPDVHYCLEEDREFHEVVLSISGHTKWTDPKRWKFDSHLNRFMEPEEFRERLIGACLSPEEAEAAMVSTVEIADLCAFDFPKFDPQFVHVGEDDSKDLSVAVVDGMEKRGLTGKLEYEERLLRELDVISNLGFESYFLVVKWVVDWCKEHQVLTGPGRGSAVGSLVSYVLGITEVDPIKYGLIFERFLHEERKGFPDIDLDVQHTQRDRLIQAISEKFGRDRVARVSTFSTLGVRQALRDVCRVFGVPEGTVSAVSKIVEARQKPEKNLEQIWASPEGMALVAENPKIKEYTERYVGLVRQAGIHASGIVIAPKPINDWGPVVNRRDHPAIAYDLEDVESMGLLKIDVLGLKYITVIREASELANEPIRYQGPFEDPKVLKEISRGRTLGAFQLGSFGMRAFCRQAKIDTFARISMANAVFRPGGLGQMSYDELVETIKTKRFHSWGVQKVDEMLADTYGILVYQEQLMWLCRSLAGFTFTEADNVRKIVGKSIGIDAMKAVKEKFVKGCLAQETLTEEEASGVWDRLEQFGRYGFNMSHSVAYSVLGYETMRFKVNHPAAFFAAAMNHASFSTTGGGEEERGQVLQQEAEERGVPFLPPDINRSIDKWRVEGTALRAPITLVDGVGEKSSAEILRARQSGEFLSEQDFMNRVEKRLVNVKIRKALAAAGALPWAIPEKKIGNPITAPNVEEFKDIRQRTKACSACPLRDSATQPVPIEIGRSNILLLGEAPGFQEDRKGKAFVGPAGKVLLDELKKSGFEREDFTISNTMKCKPSGKLPEKLIGCCPFVLEEIERLKPPVIVAFGNTPLKLFSDKFGIMKTNGIARKYEKTGAATVVHVLHPASVLYRDGVKDEFKRGLRAAVRAIEKEAECSTTSK